MIYFIKFLAVVSISLGVLNLVPVPVLDGGHLLFFLVEAVKGSPLSERAQLQGQRIGAALLLALMGLGVDSLSMSASSLPRVKWVIRSFAKTAAVTLLAVFSAIAQAHCNRSCNQGRDVTLALDGNTTFFHGGSR